MTAPPLGIVMSVTGMSFHVSASPRRHWYVMPLEYAFMTEDSVTLPAEIVPTVGEVTAPYPT